VLLSTRWSDGLSAIESLLASATIEACMPPHVPVPRKGPCPKHRPDGIATVAKKKAKAAPKAAPKGQRPVPPVPAAPPAAPPGTPPAVAALPRTPGKPESVTVAAKNTNPAFGLTDNPGQPTYPEQGRAGAQWAPDMGPPPSGAFEMNCTNVVLAWDMRMRGYDVQAAPSPILDKYGHGAGRPVLDVDRLLAEAYVLPNGKPHGRSFYGKDYSKGFTQPWRSFADMDAEIAHSWPDGARGIITVGKHVFNVVKANGKARYVEAQAAVTPTRIVTDKYKRRYRASSIGRIQEGKLVRVDDLVPGDGMLQAVSTAEQNRRYAAARQLAGTETP
jgi:hypothetical protein